MENGKMTDKVQKNEAADRVADRDKALAAAMSQIEKQFGKGSVMKLGDRSDRALVPAISTGSLSLDAALGIGGLPRGRIVEIYGPEGGGKTTLALQAIAEAQKAGGRAAFIDAEHALDPVYARNIGVDVDELIISQPDYAEQALEIADMLVQSGGLDVFALDSVAALVPRVELEGMMGGSVRGTSGAPHVPGSAQTCRCPEQVTDVCYLHQPVAREDWRHVWESGGHPRWAGSEILLIREAGSASRREYHRGRRGHWQQDKGKGCQEQDGTALSGGAV